MRYFGGLAIGFLFLVAVALVPGPVRAFEPPQVDGKMVTIPNTKPEAAQALNAWIDGRGLDSTLQGNLVIYRKEGAILMLNPLVSERELDRILFIHVFNPKPEFKGSKQLEALTADANQAQNFLKLNIDKDGDLVIESSLTFCDQITAHEFDRFFEYFLAVERKFVLTPDMLKFLK